MATTYDKASLVMIPSGYKDDKLYSIKPTDGSGDFTFSRDGAGASPATRVNASGLIEKGRENVLLQSNNFGTTWVTSGTISATSGQSGYDGSSDAWLLDKGSASAYIYQSVSNSGVTTFSCYAKAGTTDWFRIRINTAGTTQSCFYDLTNGVIGTNTSIESKIESIGGGWYRCTLAFNETTTEVRLYPAEGDLDLTGTSGNIYIQDAQLESGLVATDYIETTTTAVSAGLLGDMPRLDYSGGATCPSLLLEPSRVNLVDHSEYIGSLTPEKGTITSNADTSPEGVVNATSFVEDSTTGRHRTSFFESVTSGQTYTFSMFAKIKSGTRLLCINNAATIGARAYFDLVNGEVEGIDAGTASIEDYGNGWYRCSVTATSSITGNATTYFGLEDGVVDNGYAGDGTSGHYWYGLQLEAGSYPTSYIPTYGSASTRGVDFGNDNDLVDTAIAFDANDDFTLFYEGSFNDLSSTSNMIMGGGRQQLGASYKNYWWAQNATSMRIVGEGETLMANTSMSITDNTNVKLLVKRSGSVIDFFVNGSKLTTTQQTTNTAFTFRSLGWAYNNPVYKVSGDIKKALVFESALTDAEAIALTTI